jgi:protocatechuate 3,4-dioxygenase beta subunit
MEPLEDRRLLAVTVDNNFVQLFNPNNGGVTQTVQGKVTVSHGPDAALAFAINYTDTAGLTIDIDADNNGTFELTYGEGNIKLGLGNANNAEGVKATQPLTMAVGELNSVVFVVPIGLVDPLANAMDRMVNVRITGGPSTDILATVGSYHGVDQTNPINNAAAAISNVVTGESKLSLGVIPAGNRALDSIMALERQTAQGIPIAITMKPDRLDTDPSDGNAAKDQIAVLNAVRTTAPNAVIHGAASSDDDDIPPNVHEMNWGFLTSGVQAFAHVAVDINMGIVIPVEYDGSDAPDDDGKGNPGYGLVLHAPKGPMLGDYRDKEPHPTVTVPNQNVFANGDDLHFGTAANPLIGGPYTSGPADDEDGVTNIGNFGGAANATLVAKGSGNNFGMVDIEVNGIDTAAKQVAYLTAHLDWGRDFSFIDAVDKLVFVDKDGNPLPGPLAITANGTQTLKFLIPSTADVVPGTSYLRVRIHTASMGEAKELAWNDPHANDGEVEDNVVQLKEAATINGIKFEDLDGDGIREAGEPPLAGVVFELFQADGVTPAKDLFGNFPTAKSDATGKFTFDNLDKGMYVVKENLLASDTNFDKITDAGGPNAKFNGDLIDQGLRQSSGLGGYAVEVKEAGESVSLKSDQTFGNFITGSIHGVKFHDVDGDAVWDKGGNDPEVALPGIKFDLWKFIGTNTNVKFSGNKSTQFAWTKINPGPDDGITNVHGEFWFAHVNPGKYLLVERAPGSHMAGMEFVVSTGQVQGDFTPADFLNKNPNDPAFAKNLFEIVSRREFVWELGAASRPVDGIGDGDPNGDLKTGLTPDGFLQAGEIAFGKAKAALKVEVLTGGAQTTIVDSLGFEAPAFKTDFLGTGQLEGQPAGNSLVWQRTNGAGTSTAEVQSAIFAPGGGNQAVELIRAPNSVDRWGVPVDGFPQTTQICIEWDMRVEGPVGVVGSQFGPFYGVEAYDDTFVVALLGSLGVDATTGDVLFQDANGFFTETGATVAFGTWHNFDLVLDFPSHTYAVYLDNILLEDKIPFVDDDKVVGGLTRFTDADITALTAAANSGALTGKGYFDNLTVKDCGVVNGPSLVYGNFKPASIHGFKFEDVNGNGSFQDGTDKVQGNVRMVLEGKDNRGNAVFRSVLTEATKDGAGNNFWFTGLAPGTYSVRESTSTNVETDPNKNKDPATDTNGDKIADVLQDFYVDPFVETKSVVSGQVKNLDHDWANYIFGSIHGIKFRDTNANGVWDKGATGDNKEAPLPGIKLDLFKFVGSTTKFTSSGGSQTKFHWEDVGDAVTNDKHGEFWFTGLAPGTYRVVELGANNPGENLSTGQATSVPPSDKDPFVNPPPAQFTIQSRLEFVWQLDQDLFNLGEPGGPGADTEAERNAIKNILNPGAFNRPMDTNGNTIIDQSEVDDAYNKAALKMQVLAPLNPAVPSVTDPVQQNSLMFGNWRFATITGFKFEDVDFNDADNDGLNDDGESNFNSAVDKAMANVWMLLAVKDTANGHIPHPSAPTSGSPPNVGGLGLRIVDAVLTKDDGTFTFNNVMPGVEYTILESFSITTGPRRGAGLVEGNSNTNNNSGTFQLGTDTNGDGIADLLQEMRADPTIRNSTPRSGQTVNLADGSGKNSWGNVILGSIHGVKFHDANGNGQWDKELKDGNGNQLEVPLFDTNGDGKSDITFHLWKLTSSTVTRFPSQKTINKFTWTKVDSESTDIHGEFWFTSLMPGDYLAIEDAGDFFISTGQFSGDPNAVKDGNTEGLDPNKLPSSVLNVRSRQEWVWELDPTLVEKDGPGADTADERAQIKDTTYGAFDRPMDLDPDLKTDRYGVVTDGPGVPNGILEGSPGNTDPNSNSEFAVAYNKAALKVQVLASPADDPAPANKGQNLQFGNVMLGTIHGFKFEDLDADGKFNPDKGDRGLANVWMLLKDQATGNIVQATKTVADDPATTGVNELGQFWFMNVRPGNYLVVESTEKDVPAAGDTDGPFGTDTNLDKVADVLQELVVDPFQEQITITSQLNKADRDRDLKHQWADFVLGSIHGVKFQDFDRDGEWDREGRLPEPAWKDITFRLYHLAKQETKLLASNITKVFNTWVEVDSMKSDIHGEFWFTSLQPGWYEVREDKRPDIESTTGQTQGAPGVFDTPQDSFTAFLIRSRLEYVWELDPNGAGPGKDPPFGAFNRPRDLDNDGFISSDEQTMAKNKSALKAEVLADGMNIKQNLFYGNNFITGSLHGLKFEDIDADGIFDQASPKGVPGGEPGLGGIWIELHDQNGKVPILANGMPAIIQTGPDGKFWFKDVMPGTYTVHEILEKTDSNGDSIPDIEQGMVSSTPLSTGPFTVLPRQEWVYTPGAAMLTKEQIAKGAFETFEDGASKNNINEKLIFGNYILGSVHGFKFLDADADGKYEPEHWQDMPFEWGAFELLDSNGKSLGIQYTDAPLTKDTDDDGVNDNYGGEFWFLDLKPGKYTLRERPDLIDRNDVNGDGFPDIVDTDGDGLPELKGNGIPDDKEGLRISTHSEITLQIWSGEELVWRPGAANLLQIDAVFVEPDDFPNLPSKEPIPIGFDFPNVELTEVISDEEIVSLTPSGFTASTGTRVFGQLDEDDYGYGYGDDDDDDDLDTFGFAGEAGIFQAKFAVPVRSVSIDVIADSGNDRGVMVAYDIFGNFLGQATTPLIGGGQVRTLTFNAPGDSRIGFVQVAGDGLTASTVGLDNLRYNVDPLKEEKLLSPLTVITEPDGDTFLASPSLMFGNFYSGAIHGLKFQQGSNTPAPNIPIQLVDQWGKIVADAKTNADGEFWFLDVKPGFYTVNEVPTAAIITMASPVPVNVGHAQAIFSADIPTADRTFYPGLQTPVNNHALTLRNLVEGSIHGLVVNQNNQPVAGFSVVLAGPENAQVTTNSAGEFHFNDLTPGAYVVNVGGQLEIVVVGSGEEEVATAGLAGTLDPGQFEFVNPELKFTVNVVIPVNEGPRVTSVKVSGTEWAEDFLTVVDVDPIDLGYKVPGGAGQLDTLPWMNINEVHVTFSENVVINAGAISLHGVSLANYGGTMTYNAATFTATLLLPAHVKADKLVLHVNDTVEDLTGNNLDGEWTNGVTTGQSGNGTEGGDFNFRFNVLPGDSNRNGTLTGPTDGVLGSDVIKVRNSQFLTTADSKYSVFDDVNGSANVSGTDVVAVRNSQFTGLPAGSPTAPAGLGASLVDSVFSGSGGGTEFGKSAAAVDTSDDSLLLLALGASSESSTDSAFSSVSDDDEGKGAEAGSVDEMFAALGV